MKKILITLAFIAIIFNAKAQFVPGVGEDRIEVLPNAAPSKTIFKVSLLGFLEEQRSLRFAAEIRLNKYLSIEPEFGYIYDYTEGVYKSAAGKVNFEQRLALRYYIPGKTLNGIYAGPLFTFSNFNYLKGDWKNVAPGTRDSIQLDFSNPWKLSESRYSLYLVAGIQPILSRHFSVDFNAGFGVQMRDVSTKFDPELINGKALPPDQRFFSTLGTLALRIGYIF